jgi:hypothetical protein
MMNIIQRCAKCGQIICRCATAISIALGIYLGDADFLSASATEAAVTAPGSGVTGGNVTAVVNQVTDEVYSASHVGPTAPKRPFATGAPRGLTGLPGP